MGTPRGSSNLPARTTIIIGSFVLVESSRCLWVRRARGGSAMVMPCTKGWTRVKAVAERLEGNKVSLSVEVDAERVDAAIGRAYRKVAKQVKIPGFRQGKVPRDVIEARFGKEALYQEALDELIPVAYEEAVQSTQIEPIDQPTVTDYEIEEGKPLKFTATVEVTPEVELGEYKGIKVEKLVEQVEAKDIDHILEHFQEDHAELVSPDRNTVEQGDFVDDRLRRDDRRGPLSGWRGEGVSA